MRGLRSHAHIMVHPLTPFRLAGPRILVLLFSIWNFNQFSRFLGGLANTRFSILQVPFHFTEHCHTSHPQVVFQDVTPLFKDCQWLHVPQHTSLDWSLWLLRFHIRLHPLLLTPTSPFNLATHWPHCHFF